MQSCEGQEGGSLHLTDLPTKDSKDHDSEEGWREI